jgi:N-acetylneuraminic acid mutarotase
MRWLLPVLVFAFTSDASGAGQWSAGQPSPVVRFEGAAAVVNDRLYAFGGFSEALGAQTSVHQFDPGSGQWSARAPMPRAVTHVQAAVIGTRVYLAGGFEGTNPGVAVADVLSYDTVANQWSSTEIPDLPAPQASAGFVALGTRLHYLGGLLADRCTDTTGHLVFDTAIPALGWTSRAAMPETRNHFQAVVLDGRIYVLGGQRGHDCGNTNLTSAHVYDPGTNQWSALAPLPAERSHFEMSVFAWNGRIVLGAGVSNTVLNVATVFAYEVANDRWVRWPDLPSARRSPILQRIGSQLIYTVGAGGPGGITGMADLSVNAVRTDVPRVLFVRGADRSGGFTEAMDDAQRTANLGDVDDFTTGPNRAWGELRATLESEGFLVTQVKETAETPSGPAAGLPAPLATLGLSSYATVVMGSNNAPYGAPAVDVLEAYVRDGGGALFISDANFGSDWSDAPTSDQAFLTRFGVTMNQDHGTYALTRAGADFVVPAHPILAGVDAFDGEGVSPAFASAAVAGVQTTVVVRAKDQTRVNAPPFGPQNLGALRPVTASDAALLAGIAGNGRFAVHLDRNTFFNTGGVGSDITRFDNRTYAINLFGWLAQSNGPPPLFADGFESP